MIKCGKLKNAEGEAVEQCVLYTKDGRRALGYFPYSEHGGEKGARAAAHKREGQVQAFKKMRKSLAEAIDEFGFPAVLEWIIEKSAGCEDCEDAILKALGAEELEVEKAKRKKRRRITIEDEDDDEDDREEPKEEKKEEGETEAEGAPPGRETKEEPEGGGEEEEKPPPPKKEGGPFGQGGGDGKMAQEGTELPKGWTPEALGSYWQKLGGSVESCVGNAPDTVKDKQTFCQRLEAKVKAVSGGEGEGEKPTPPKPPMEKSVDEPLDTLAEKLVEKAKRRAWGRVGAGEGVRPEAGYRGEVGWDDPQSWLKTGTPDSIREKAWKAMGSSVTGCMAKVKRKVDDPGRFCAALKDRVLGTTKWRGKKAGVEKSLLSELEELTGDAQPAADEELEAILKSLPEADVSLIVEKAEPETDESGGEEGPTFLGLIRESHETRMSGIVKGLVDDMEAELEEE